MSLKYFALIFSSALLPSISLVASEEITPLPPRPLPSVKTTSSLHRQVTPEQGTARVLPKANASERKPYIVNDVKPRPSLQPGYYVGIYAGSNIIQDTYKNENPPFSYQNFTTATVDSSPGPATGIKFGYIWSFDEEPEEIFENLAPDGLRFSGSLELDFMYYSPDYKINSNGQFANFSSDDISVDSFSLMTYAMLNAGHRNWAVRLGGGIGGVATFADSNFHAANNVVGQGAEDETLDISAGIVGGLDYYIDYQWSIFAEYKVNWIFDQKLYDAVASDVEHHFLTLGLKRHF